MGNYLLCFIVDTNMLSLHLSCFSGALIISILSVYKLFQFSLIRLKIILLYFPTDYITFAVSKIIILTYGVMVALQILDLSV
jgi:hypothetical protein